MTEFVPLAERIVDAVLAANPRTATVAGDHRFDDRLPDLSRDGVIRDLAMLRDAADAGLEIGGRTGPASIPTPSNRRTRSITRSSPQSSNAASSS